MTRIGAHRLTHSGCFVLFLMMKVVFVYAPISVGYGYKSHQRLRFIHLLSDKTDAMIFWPLRNDFFLLQPDLMKFDIYFMSPTYKLSEWEYLKWFLRQHTIVWPRRGECSCVSFISGILGSSIGRLLYTCPKFFLPHGIHF